MSLARSAVSAAFDPATGSACERVQPNCSATAEDRRHVTNMELFFDLVYVFAFTQLSELLYEHLTWPAAGETAVIFVALWWAWNYTAWATGWVDPERAPVVLLLSVLMIASLVMATAILEAFDGRGETFAIAYVVMQLLRSGFMVWVFGLREPMGRNYAQLFVWSAISGAIWIIGGTVTIRTRDC